MIWLTHFLSLLTCYIINSAAACPQKHDPIFARKNIFLSHINLFNLNLDLDLSNLNWRSHPSPSLVPCTYMYKRKLQMWDISHWLSSLQMILTLFLCLTCSSLLAVAQLFIMEDEGVGQLNALESEVQTTFWPHPEPWETETLMILWQHFSSISSTTRLAWATLSALFCKQMIRWGYTQLIWDSLMIYNDFFVFLNIKLVWARGY